MNERLKPVFNILLIGLEKAAIDYWVYGGISIAAYAGRFVRENGDIDIFVREDSFGKAADIIEEICRENSFKFVLTKSERPKIDVYINNKQLFSMIPVYPKDDSIEFKYKKVNEYYSDQILERAERVISGFRFFTPPDQFIREMFINHMKARPEKMKRPEFIKDAECVGFSG